MANDINIYTYVICYDSHAFETSIMLSVVLNVIAKKSEVQVRQGRRVSDCGSGDQPIIDDDAKSTRSDVS